MNNGCAQGCNVSLIPSLRLYYVARGDVSFFDPVREMIATGHLDTVGITDVSAEGIFTLKR